MNEWSIVVNCEDDKEPIQIAIIQESYRGSFHTKIFYGEEDSQFCYGPVFDTMNDAVEYIQRDHIEPMNAHVDFLVIPGNYQQKKSKFNRIRQRIITYAALIAALFIPLVVAWGLNTCLSVQVPTGLTNLSSACMIVSHLIRNI